MIDIYADGSFRPKTATGGWAFVAFQNDREIHRAQGFARGLSNNTFELRAVLEAALWIGTDWIGTNRIGTNWAGASATIWTDSRQTVTACHASRAIWRNNGWRRLEANPKRRKRVIQDVALWQALDRQLTANPRIEIAWCRGHDDIAGNELADALARTAAMASKVSIG